MGKYNDEVKTCENLAKEFFEELESIIYAGLMKDNKHYYLVKVTDLMKKYKEKMIG